MTDFDNPNVEVPPKSLIKIILRWLAVIPVGIIGLFLGMIVVNIFALFGAWYTGDNLESSGYYKIMYNAISPFIGGVLAVYWSAKVAPTHKKIVATVMAAIILIIDVISTMYSISAKENSLFWVIITGLAIAIGAGYMMYYVYENEDDFKFLND